jgi:hypothetical protein
MTVESRLDAEEKAKKLVMSMNGLSWDGYLNKMRNDPYFRSGVMVIVDMIMHQK